MQLEDTYFCCKGILYECKKFPPKTSESLGVKTAWIQPGSKYNGLI